MKSIKKLLRIGGIVSIAYGLLITIFDSTIFTYLNIIIGVIVLLLGTKSDENITNKKNALFVIGLFQLFTCFISGICFLIASNKMNSEALVINSIMDEKKNVHIRKKAKKTEKDKISKEAKRIDILLKLGVLLVILSGIIFATSSWDAINNIAKSSFILLLSGLFYLLSLFFGKKVIIEKSEKIYDILCKVFFLCFVVSICYLGTFGTWFSFNGDGKFLCYALISMTSAFLVYISRKKYNIALLGEIVYSLILLSLFFVIKFIYDDVFLIISIFSCIALLGHLINKDDKSSFVHFVNNVLLVILMVLYPNRLFEVSVINMFRVLPAIIIFVTNYLFISKNDGFKEVFQITLPLIICTYSLLIFNNILDSDLMRYIYTFMVSEMVFLVFTRSKEKLLNITSTFVSSMFMIAMCMFTLILGDFFPSMIMSLVFVMNSIYNYYYNGEAFSRKLSFVLQFVGAIFFASSCSHYLDELEMLNTNFNSRLQLAFSLFGLLLFIEKEKLKENNKFAKISCTLVLLFSLINISGRTVNNIIYNIVMALILCMIRYFVIKKDSKDFSFVLDSFIILTFVANFLEIFKDYNILSLGSIILLGALAVLSILLRNNKKMLGYNSLISLLPLLVFIKYSNCSYEVITMIKITALLIDLYVVCNSLIQSEKASKIIEIVVSLILFSTYIFKTNITLGIYTGIITIIMILLSTKFDKLNHLFITGIIVLLVNLVVQLFEFWSKIPLFIYLLVAGLLLIGFVTYKEVNKDKPKKKNELFSKIFKSNNTSITKINPIKYDVLLLIIGSIVLYNVYESYCNKEKDYYDDIEEYYTDNENLYYDNNEKILYVRASYKDNFSDTIYDIKYSSHSSEYFYIIRISDECFNGDPDKYNRCEVLKEYSSEYNDSDYISFNNYNIYADSGTFNYFKMRTEYEGVHISYDEYQVNNSTLCFNKDNDEESYKMIIKNTKGDIINTIIPPETEKCIPMPQDYGDIYISIEK